MLINSKRKHIKFKCPFVGRFISHYVTMNQCSHNLLQRSVITDIFGWYFTISMSTIKIRFIFSYHKCCKRSQPTAALIITHLIVSFRYFLSFPFRFLPFQCHCFFCLIQVVYDKITNLFIAPFYAKEHIGEHFHHFIVVSKLVWKKTTIGPVSRPLLDRYYYISSSFPSYGVM